MPNRRTEEDATICDIAMRTWRIVPTFAAPTFLRLEQIMNIGRSVTLAFADSLTVRSLAALTDEARTFDATRRGRSGRTVESSSKWQAPQPTHPFVFRASARAR
jgi:hypothetical protein